MVAAAVVLVVLSLVVFAGGLRGAAVSVTVADDAVVRWLAGWHGPGVVGAMQVLAAVGSWMAITVLLWGLLLALLILRRLRHLLVVLAVWIVQGLLLQYLLGPLLSRPRPFGVEHRTDWTGWAMPSEQMAALVVALLGILYALVPEDDAPGSHFLSRLGNVMLSTSLRSAYAAVDPSRAGFTVVDVKQQSTAAAAGSTDFGAYFSYFSFFLMVSALLLSALFFRLSIEQRLAQIGVLRATGFRLADIRRLFLLEASVVIAAGAVAGVVLAVGWAALMMFALRTWWVGAVGTTQLRLHVDASSLVIGAVGAAIAAFAAIAWTVRSLNQFTPRSQLSGRLRNAWPPFGREDDGCRLRLCRAPWRFPHPPQLIGFRRLAGSLEPARWSCWEASRGFDRGLRDRPSPIPAAAFTRSVPGPAQCRLAARAQLDRGRLGRGGCVPVGLGGCLSEERRSPRCS